MDTKPKTNAKLPADLVAEMVRRLESENTMDWTREFGAAGGLKTTAPV